MKVLQGEVDQTIAASDIPKAQRLFNVFADLKTDTVHREEFLVVCGSNLRCF